jgi:hypothetical protein
MRVVRRQRRQLQNSRKLTGEQPRQEDDFPVGELKRIVMGMRIVIIYPTKLSYLSRCRLAWVKEVESGLIFDLLLEGEFRAGKQTNRNPRLSRGSETSGN